MGCPSVARRVRLERGVLTLSLLVGDDDPIPSLVVAQSWFVLAIAQQLLGVAADAQTDIHVPRGWLSASFGCAGVLLRGATAFGG
jgi:hypothetical protein